MTLVVKGLREFSRALAAADLEAKRTMRRELADAGDLLRQEGQTRFEPFDSRSAAGYRVYVRQRGVGVEQSLRKTTGKHPEFGAKQMEQALIPARNAVEPRIARDFERAFDRICDQIERR